jgi:hypothetical protein
MEIALRFQYLKAAKRQVDRESAPQLFTGICKALGRDALAQRSFVRIVEAAERAKNAGGQDYLDTVLA